MIEVRWNGTLLLTANLNATTVRNRQLLALPPLASNETGQLEIRVSAAGLVDIDGVGVWKHP